MKRTYNPINHGLKGEANVAICFVRDSGWYVQHFTPVIPQQTILREPQVFRAPTRL